MKGLYRRGDIWWVRFTPFSGGKQMFLSTGETDEAAAILRARDLMDRAKVEAVIEVNHHQLEIDNYLKHLKNRGLADSSVSTRKYILQSFVDQTEVSMPRKVTKAMVQKWFDGRRELNERTAVEYFKHVRWWFEWLDESGKLIGNPCHGIELPKLKMQIRKNFLRPDQARKLLNACDDEGLKFALYCGIQAGMRKMEVIEARPDWFDLEARLIHIQRTTTFSPKGRKNRTVPITDEFFRFLEVYGLREPFMLHPKVKHGKYRYRYDFKRSFNSLVLRCGFEDLTFHDLRRTFASLLVSKGVSIYKVAKWLGDKVEVVEDKYGHLIPKDDEINAAWE